MENCAFKCIKLCISSLSGSLHKHATQKRYWWKVAKDHLTSNSQCCINKIVYFSVTHARPSNSQRQAASEPPGRDNGKRRCKPPSQKLINSNANVGQKSPTTNDLISVFLFERQIDLIHKIIFCLVCIICDYSYSTLTFNMFSICQK